MSVEFVHGCQDATRAPELAHARHRGSGCHIDRQRRRPQRPFVLRSARHEGNPDSGTELCLVARHRSNGPFDEFRIGLDHLEFLVAQRGDLDAWASRLGKRGIQHSGVKEPPYTANAMLTFRDPDNIQLEFFWRAASNLRLDQAAAAQAG